MDNTTNHNSEITFVLGDFKGPMHLLLELVKSAKIDISQLFVSAVTNQYLDYMSQIETIDIDRAAEFLNMAAILLEIKSKRLLPRIEEELIDGELPEERELKRRLDEFRLMQEAANQLRQREVLGAYARPSSINMDETTFVLKDMSTLSLANALNSIFLRLTKRASIPKQRKIVLDKFTVSDKMASIRNIISIKKRCSFDELFAENYNKSEVITTFQALLELLKFQEVFVQQDEIFGKIEIIHREPIQEDIPTFSIEIDE